jgi:hypothetical protein
MPTVNPPETSPSIFSTATGFQRRFVAALIAGLVMMVGVAIWQQSRAEDETIDLQSINLDVTADIQAGTTWFVSVPEVEGVSLSVGTAPEGVDASIYFDANENVQVLEVKVDGDAPRGAYNLGIEVDRDGELTTVNWPFAVVNPGE